MEQTSAQTFTLFTLNILWKNVTITTRDPITYHRLQQDTDL